MKLSLNLGCGDRYVAGWTNIDYKTPHRVDQRVDLTGPLPWEPGSVSRVYAGHLFEHITPDQCRELSKRLLTCMDPDGGVLVVVGPDVPVAEDMIRDGTFDFTYHSLESLRNGAGRWAGDVHLWETSGPLVAEIVRDAGWPVVHAMRIAELEGGWPVADREPQWQYAVRAYTGDLT